MAIPGAVMALLIGAAAAQPQSIDPHQLYEQNCGGCHALHAGEFAHDNLVRVDGKTVGRKSGVELRTFLETGHGRLAPDEIVVIVAQLNSILTAGQLFQEKCRVCHDRAAKFARLNLAVEEGELIGRYSKRDIARFLIRHGRLAPDQVAKMVDVLKRQLVPQQTE